MKLLFRKRLIVSIIMFCVVSVSYADNSDDQKYQCKLISRADAIKQAKKKANGKVVGVQLNDRGSRSVYKVRMLIDEKRVKTFSISACR